MTCYAAGVLMLVGSLSGWAAPADVAVTGDWDLLTVPKLSPQRGPYSSPPMLKLGMSTASSAAPPAPIAPMMTLADVVELARAGPSASSAQALARAAAADRDQASWALYPRANLNYSRDTNRAYYDEQSGQLQLTASYTVYDGGRARANVRAKDAVAQAQGYGALSKSDQAALGAVQAYLAILRFERLAQIARANIDRHAYVRHLIAEIVTVDPGRSSDLALVDSRLAVARRTHDEFEQQKGTAATQFEEVVGQPPGPLALPILAPDQRLAGLDGTRSARVDDYSPELNAARHNLAAALANVDANRRWYAPDVIVQAVKPMSASGQYATGSYKWYAGIQLQWDTTDRLSGMSALRGAQARAESARQDIETARRGVRQKLADLFNVLASVRARQVAATQQVGSLEQVSQAYWDQFQIGRRSLLDALNMQSDLFASQIQQAGLQLDELQTQLSVYTQEGKLDEEAKRFRYAPLASLAPQGRVMKVGGRVKARDQVKREEAGTDEE